VTTEGSPHPAPQHRDGFETRAIHHAQPPDPVTGAVVPPISLSTTFAQSEHGADRGFAYSRGNNPTRQAYEECLASLESASHGFAFASGTAASDAVLRLLPPGDHVVFPHDAYAGTFRLLTQVCSTTGTRWSVHDLGDPEALAAAWPDGTSLVWMETPTNPLLEVVDIRAICALAHERGARVVVDNTFATPYLQRPLEHGADIVVHSATKYLGGHSDVMGGFAATRDPEIAERLGFLQAVTGAVPSPFDCYLVLRGVKTLAVRMDRHCQNASAIVSMLVKHPAVARVHHPSLADNPGSAVARRQMRDYGGMVSFLAAGGEPAARRIVAGTRLFTLAESLGGVESLIGHPARMSHGSAHGTALEVDPALVRISVGIESTDDLVADLRAALDAALDAVA
jgi:cystathionine gamma-synthase